MEKALFRPFARFFPLSSSSKDACQTLLLGILLFLGGVYPFLHNPLLYFINITSVSLGTHISPYMNLFLIGLKDILILPTLLTLLLLSSRVHFVCGLLVLGLVFICGGVTGIKNLFEPLFFLCVLLLYRKVISQSFERWGPKAMKFLARGLAAFVAVGSLDLLFRLLHDLKDTWTEYPYLLANNEYRCAKYFLGSVTEREFYNCLTWGSSFYRLGFREGEYVVFSSLFLPFGDSVVFSTLIFYFLVFALVIWLKAERKPTPTEVVFFTLFSVSVFLTLNRVNSLICLAMGLCVLGFVWLRHAQSKSERRILLAALICLVGAYGVRSEYLFRSLFDPRTPSNIGHAVLEQGLPNQGLMLDAGAKVPEEAWRRIHFLQAPTYFSNWLKQKASTLQRANSSKATRAHSDDSFVSRCLRIFYDGAWDIGLLTLPLLLILLRGQYLWAGAYILFLCLYQRLSEQLGFPIQIFTPKYTGPTESDFIKALVNHGALGVAIYSVILAYILSRVVQCLIRGATEATTLETRCRRAALALMGAQFLFYQKMAPYFISGFVIFFAFAGIWVVLVERELSKETPWIPHGS